MAGAPINNTNAEKWTFKQAEQLFEKAVELSYDREYDFIGEIARELKLYKEIFTYLSEKFDELKPLHNLVLSNCESNCFYNGKKSNITPSLAIMNLKSNHGWTDRQDLTTQGDKLPTPPIQWIKNESDS
jgi:hypothetical protein